MSTQVITKIDVFSKNEKKQGDVAVIEKLEIAGFKSIDSAELELNKLNILIGANGVGKSNFISFFQLVDAIFQKELQQYALTKGVESLLHYGRKTTKQIVGKLSFGLNEYQFMISPDEQDGVLLQENSIYNGNGWYKGTSRESSIKDSPIYRDTFLTRCLKSHKVHQFHDTSISSPMRSATQIDDNRYLKGDGSNLPAFLYYLQKKDASCFSRIEEVVSEIIPFFHKFDLAPDRQDESKIKLVWKNKNYSEHYFDARHMSDGSLRIIALLTLLLQQDLPSTIIIDEPELGLHPFAINKLAGAIQSAIARGAQVIISTQSVSLISNFEPEDIITVNTDGTKTTFERLKEKELNHWMEHYTIGDMWIKQIIKGQVT